jgi:hypothetical protein
MDRYECGSVNKGMHVPKWAVYSFLYLKLKLELFRALLLNHISKVERADSECRDTVVSTRKILLKGPGFLIGSSVIFFSSFNQMSSLFSALFHSPSN